MTEPASADAGFTSKFDQLRNWAAGDQIRSAAVGLLIWHSYWLRRSDFWRAAIEHYPSDRMAAIRWDKAREYLAAGPSGSASELAVLDIAVTIGENRFRLSGFGPIHRRAVAEAFAAAVGLALEPAVPGAVHDHPEFIPGDPATCSACAVASEDDGGTGGG
jgi:hypothetical protein